MIPEIGIMTKQKVRNKKKIPVLMLMQEESEI